MDLIVLLSKNEELVGTTFSMSHFCGERTFSFLILLGKAFNLHSATDIAFLEHFMAGVEDPAGLRNLLSSNQLML
jgi:hypothetical protein